MEPGKSAISRTGRRTFKPRGFEQRAQTILGRGGGGDSLDSPKDPSGVSRGRPCRIRHFAGALVRVFVAEIAERQRARSTSPEQGLLCVPTLQTTLPVP